MSSHFLSYDYAPPRVNTYRKRLVRTVAELATEHDYAKLKRAADRHAATKTVGKKNEATARKAIACIESPVQRHHVIRPRSVKAERRYNNA